jgi:hypothetical protein
MIVEEFNTQIIANDNKIANPNFNEKTNRWSITNSLVGTPINNGIRLSGVGTFYQKLATDVVSGETQQCLVYISAITDVATLKIGTTVNGTDLGQITLVTGWNTLNFTAGANNYVTLDLASGTVDVTEVNVKKTEDLIVSGSIVVGKGFPSTLPLGTTWRVRVDSNTLVFEYSTDNFTTSIVANTLIAE